MVSEPYAFFTVRVTVKEVPYSFQKCHTGFFIVVSGMV
jgi:hypothetical protein